MSAPADVAMLSAKLAMDALYAAAGLPLPTGRPRLDLLPRLSPESQDEARRALHGISAEWNAAGRPYLNGERIAKTYTYTKSCMNKKERNDRI
ncbi:hypothetical protein [Sphingomonas turrisvirgatae]|uniref:Uncharacterized protein n=1 Tax=Sphingomonas turrisvirgatae TaxID=1888892 RepID=A0A1E3LR15_9SPHN|nr:hypothetical protein [Sphingomonas turrisvirgatae]ODP36201.1 hypothetical protein BFL28_07270 [Sphingomonas turrisvirgatae]